MMDDIKHITKYLLPESRVKYISAISRASSSCVEAKENKTLKAHDYIALPTTYIGGLMHFRCITLQSSL